MLKPPAAYRPLWFRGADRAFRAAWAAGLSPDPVLDEDRLIAMARQQTGLTDFGRSDWRPAFSELVRALREEAGLHAMGRLIAFGSMLKALKERLWAERLFRTHPEIEATTLAPPLVIVGPMRSGTTRLQRLIACDPQFSHLRLFEAMCPAPWPRSRRGGRDPRRGYTRFGLGFLNLVNPQIAASHPTGAEEPDEELGLLEASFWGAQIEAQRPIPGFARWSEAADARPAYAQMARLLKLAAWWKGAAPDTPWLLKTPQHMANLDTLLDVLPGARIVFTHRDPVAVVASSASLAWNQMVVQTDRLDPAWVGAEWLHKTAWRVARTEAVRAGRDVPAIDMRFEEVERDWRGAVRRIYARFDLELTPATMAAMEVWSAREAVRPRHAAHRYSLQDFGLSREAVEERLGAYGDRYDVRRREGSAHQGVSG